MRFNLISLKIYGLIENERIKNAKSTRRNKDTEKSSHINFAYDRYDPQNYMCEDLS